MAINASHTLEAKVSAEVRKMKETTAHIDALFTEDYPFVFNIDEERKAPYTIDDLRLMFGRGYHAAIRDNRDAKRYQFWRSNGFAYYESRRRWVLTDKQAKVIATGDAPNIDSAIDAAMATFYGGTL